MKKLCLVSKRFILAITFGISCSALSHASETKLVATPIKKSQISMEAKFTLESLSEIDPAAAEAQNSLLYLYSNLTIKGLTPGIVVASPSMQNPNYFFHWLRDASLTMLEIVQSYSESNNTAEKNTFKGTLQTWISNEYKLQDKALKSSFLLGEPLFTVYGDIYPNPWGRPQNDGPAIRALTVSLFALKLLSEGSQNNVYVNSLYTSDLPATSIIKRDLEYVAHHWQESSFDLWEEVKGDHFFTRMAQRSALIVGARLASMLNDPGASNYYLFQAANIEDAIKQHVDYNRNVVQETLNQVDGWNHKKSNLDVAVILASLYFSLNDDFFAPSNPYILSTANQLESAFKNNYAINQNTSLGTAIGRYPEDIYNGNGFGQGNPWFLATNAYAELYCRLSRAVINNVDTRRFLEKGRLHLKRTLTHIDADGHMSEQFNSNSGALQGARDLTWSYVSFLRAQRACQHAGNQ